MIDTIDYDPIRIILNFFKIGNSKDGVIYENIKSIVEAKYHGYSTHQQDFTEIFLHIFEIVKKPPINLEFFTKNLKITYRENFSCDFSMQQKVTFVEDLIMNLTISKNVDFVSIQHLIEECEKKIHLEKETEDGFTDYRKIIDETSKYILIFLNRTEFSENKIFKNNTNISNTSLLSITDNNYSLISFVTHQGESALACHYTVCFLSDGDWLCANDNKIIKLSKNEVTQLANQACYYFYKKISE